MELINSIAVGVVVGVPLGFLIFDALIRLRAWLAWRRLDRKLAAMEARRDAYGVQRLSIGGTNISVIRNGREKPTVVVRPK